MWVADLALLVEQSLIYITDGKVDHDLLTKARFRKQSPTFRNDFYLRTYGGRNLRDQIVYEFSPKDDIFEHRAAITMSLIGIDQLDVQTAMNENFAKHGFRAFELLETGYRVYSDGVSDIEVFFMLHNDTASISIRKI